MSTVYIAKTSYIKSTDSIVYLVQALIGRFHKAVVKNGMQTTSYSDVELFAIIHILSLIYSKQNLSANLQIYSLSD